VISSPPLSVFTQDSLLSLPWGSVLVHLLQKSMLLQKQNGNPITRLEYCMHSRELVNYVFNCTADQNYWCDSWYSSIFRYYRYEVNTEVGSKATKYANQDPNLGNVDHTSNHFNEFHLNISVYYIEIFCLCVVIFSVKWFVTAGIYDMNFYEASLATVLIMFSSDDNYNMAELHQFHIWKFSEPT